MVRELREYEIADGILTPSSVAAATYVERGVDPAKVIGIPLGVDLNRFTPGGEPSSNSFEVLFAGHFTLRKGVPYLLQAFAALDHPSKKLTVAGVVDRDLVRHLARKGISTDGVDFRGPVSQQELITLMQRASVLALPSVEEGFGLVVTQAMACGTPVLITAQTGAADVVTHLHSGLIMPSAEAELLGEYLQLLADDQHFCDQLGQNARQTMEDLGGWRSYEDRVIETILRVAKAPTHGE